jgi:hypothetical protein
VCFHACGRASSRHARGKSDRSKKADKQLEDQMKFKQTWQIPFYLAKKDQESGFVQEQRAIEEDALAWEMLEQEKFHMEMMSANRGNKTTANVEARSRALAEIKPSERKKKISAPVAHNPNSYALLGL